MWTSFGLALVVMAAGSTAAPDVATGPAGIPRSTSLTTSLKTTRMANANSDVPAGLTNYARALIKRGSKIPDGLAKRLRRGVTGSTNPALDLNSGEWVTEAEYGTPPQKLNVILDTGSWDNVVFSSQSNKSGIPSGIPIYEPEKSTTAKKLDGFTFEIHYGSGDNEADGDVFLDVVSVAGITANSQVVESVINYSPIFPLNDASGILGVALNRNNTVKPKKQKTFFDNIKDKLASPVLTANLYLEAESSYDFGFINKSLIEGPITWADVDTSPSQQGWWSINVGGFRVGSKALVASPFKSIVDTGTSTAFFPPRLVDAYYAAVPSAVNSTDFGGFVFPCNTTLPDLHLEISGRELIFPSNQLNLGTVEGDTCFGTIQAVPPSVLPDLPQPTAVLGVAFMLRYLTAFDLGSLKVGFAQKRFIENVTLASVP